MPSHFQRLDVYRLAAAVSDELHRNVRGWPAFAQRTIGTQMVRAADSIGANIAEAAGRGSVMDQRRLIFIARGSAYELEHWFERALRRGLAVPHVQAEITRIQQGINGLLRRNQPPR